MQIGFWFVACPVCKPQTVSRIWLLCEQVWIMRPMKWQNPLLPCCVSDQSLSAFVDYALLHYLQVGWGWNSQGSSYGPSNKVPINTMDIKVGKDVLQILPHMPSKLLLCYSVNIFSEQGRSVGNSLCSQTGMNLHKHLCGKLIPDDYELAKTCNGILLVSTPTALIVAENVEAHCNTVVPPQ